MQHLTYPLFKERFALQRGEPVRCPQGSLGAADPWILVRRGRGDAARSESGGTM